MLFRSISFQGLCSLVFSKVVSTHLQNAPLNLYEQATKGFISQLSAFRECICFPFIDQFWIGLSKKSTLTIFFLNSSTLPKMQLLGRPNHLLTKKSITEGVSFVRHFHTTNEPPKTCQIRKSKSQTLYPLTTGIICRVYWGYKYDIYKNANRSKHPGSKRYLQGLLGYTFVGFYWVRNAQKMYAEDDTRFLFPKH